MKAKEIFKAPIYLITLFICICFAIAFLVSVFEKDNDIASTECGSLDVVYNAVLDKFAFDADEIDSFSIACEKADNEDYRTYQVSITVGEEVREFTVNAFSDGQIDVLENASGSENETETVEGADSNKSYGETSKAANENSGDSKYADTALVKERVLMDSLLKEEQVNFLSFTLDESGETPVYEVVFETKDGYRKYIYHANALNGLLRDRTYYNADDVWDEDNIFWYLENEEDDGARGRYTYYNIWENLKTQACRGSQSFYGEPIYPEWYGE